MRDVCKLTLLCCCFLVRPADPGQFYSGSVYAFPDAATPFAPITHRIRVPYHLPITVMSVAVGLAHIDAWVNLTHVPSGRSAVLMRPQYACTLLNTETVSQCGFACLPARTPA